MTHPIRVWKPDDEDYPYRLRECYDKPSQLFVKGNINDIDFKVNAGYFQTDSGFWSELASSPVYQGRSTIFNANAFYGNSTDSLVLATFGASSLENLYFNVYNSTTLQATNLMSSTDLGHALLDQDESKQLFFNLNNNYKNGHFYRNGYSGVTAKKMELDPLMVLDPSVGLALPLGLATPDRKGITAKADVNWADKVTFNARVNIVTQSNAIVGENKFTEFAVGVGVGANSVVYKGKYDDYSVFFQPRIVPIRASFNPSRLGRNFFSLHPEMMRIDSAMIRRASEVANKRVGAFM